MLTNVDLLGQVNLTKPYIQEQIRRQLGCGAFEKETVSTLEQDKGLRQAQGKILLVELNEFYFICQPHSKML